MVNSDQISGSIFAHRGLWKLPIEQNSQQSILGAFNKGFAVETDIRDYFGKLIISHDPLQTAENLNVIQLTENHRFALNIKEDGLLKHYEDNREMIVESASFLFDGSVPQMYGIMKLGIPHALRLSEFESEIPWKSEYLWIDGLESDWWMQSSDIYRHLDNFHCVFVSPELHGRNYSQAFEWFAQLKQLQDFDFSICTDFPIELRAVCNE